LNHILVLIAVLTMPACVAVILYLFNIGKKNKTAVTVPQKKFKPISLEDVWVLIEQEDGFKASGSIKGNEMKIGFATMPITINTDIDFFDRLCEISVDNITQIADLKWTCSRWHKEKYEKPSQRKSIIIMEEDMQKINVYDGSGEISDANILFSFRRRYPIVEYIDD